MNAEMIHRTSPEEQELFALRKKLEILQLELGENELLLANLKAELRSFEGIYLRRVGTLYAELDEWRARLYELRAWRAGTLEAKAEATEARGRAEDSRSQANTEAAKAAPFIPSAELKKLYRAAAKLVHPDVAVDESDRLRRDKLMKKVNAAYAAGDESTLKHILDTAADSPDGPQIFDIGATLCRVRRQLGQTQNRIAAVVLELAYLADTEIAKLKAKSDLAAKQDRDVLAEMAASVQAQVNVARYIYESELAAGVRS